MTHAHDTRDLRGFEWRLAALQRKLEWDRDAAQSEGARVLSAWQGACDALQAAQALLAQGGAEARLTVRTQSDPRAHRRVLGYLVALGERVDAAERDERAAAGTLEAARVELLERQRQLDVVLRARSDALDAHLQQRASREAFEADASWLALHDPRRTGSNP